MAANKYFPSKLGYTMITVIVGEDANEQKFAVHKDLICSRSEFFRTCMNGKWKESEDKIVKLPEEDPKVFERYLQSLYAGHVNHPEDTTFDPSCFTIYGRLFALAQKFLDRDARNMVVKAIFEEVSRSVILSGKRPSSELCCMISQIWEVAAFDGPVRALLIQIFVFFNMDNSGAEADAECNNLLECFRKLPLDYVGRVTTALIMKRRDAYSSHLDQMRQSWQVENYLGKNDEGQEQAKNKGWKKVVFEVLP
ncbi:hypothetical protein BDV95DRAFT_112896 [Massariosphaeria phaeospora]|uniref:BTB domain-containing protein n=1 Tax=Massariosphaeria phaeospora TaxID=100035 RepID=A0A7C8I2I0_9PLEO|nr:hypothetical protein BDV95DRAFT_112896 [Massariosphaeria phaeospora]